MDEQPKMSQFFIGSVLETTCKLVESLNCRSVICNDVSIGKDEQSYLEPVLYPHVHLQPHHELS